MAMITEVYAREILDSRGNPTVEVGWKTALSAALPYLPVHPPAYTKLLSCAMAIKNVTAAKAFAMRSIMSTTLSPKH